MSEIKATSKRSQRIRLLVGIGVPLGMVLLVLAVVFLQRTPPCIFYELTGLYCPGCGAGRAMLALMRGDFLAALDHQPLMLMLSPFLAYYVLKVYIAFVFERDVLPFFRVSTGMAVTLTATIVAYWILRNIPVFPFSVLAP